MNIEKLAKHLKEFTLDEIEMIAEVNCKTELEQLLNANKIVLKNKKYEYIEQESLDFDIFATTQKIDKNLTFESSVKYFLKEYVIKNCSKRTYETYFSIFKTILIPYFKKKPLNDIRLEDIKGFYIDCQNRKIGNSRLKNTLTQLNQLIRYFQEQGIIDTKCVFQVRRLTAKNEFNESRLTFKENL